jgi:hypothetical protein
MNGQPKTARVQLPPVSGKAETRPRAGRKPKTRSPSVRRKNLSLDQKKLDFLRTSLGLRTDQEVVERVIDEAVVDRELIDATLALRGALPRIVDVGKPR